MPTKLGYYRSLNRNGTMAESLTKVKTRNKDKEWHNPESVTINSNKREGVAKMMGKQKKLLLAISVQWVRLEINVPFRAGIVDANTDAGLTTSSNNVITLKTLGGDEKPMSAKKTERNMLKIYRIAYEHGMKHHKEALLSLSC